MATVLGIDALNRKQLEKNARNLGIYYTAADTRAQLVTKIKAK